MKSIFKPSVYAEIPLYAYKGNKIIHKQIKNYSDWFKEVLTEQTDFHYEDMTTDIMKYFIPHLEKNEGHCIGDGGFDGHIYPQKAGLQAYAGNKPLIGRIPYASNKAFETALVQAGRAMQIGLAGQNEQTTVEIQVLNPRSGLIATSPPWFKAKWELGRVIWPNGATAHVRTPESPGNIRGIEFDLAWLSETQSWPRVQGFEAWANFLAATRLGYARIVYDCTPKPFAPIVKQ